MEFINFIATLSFLAASSGMKELVRFNSFCENIQNYAHIRWTLRELQIGMPIEYGVIYRDENGKDVPESPIGTLYYIGENFFYSEEKQQILEIKRKEGSRNFFSDKFIYFNWNDYNILKGKDIPKRYHEELKRKRSASEITEKLGNTTGGFKISNRGYGLGSGFLKKVKQMKYQLCRNGYSLNMSIENFCLETGYDFEKIIDHLQYAPILHFHSFHTFDMACDKNIIFRLEDMIFFNQNGYVYSQTEKQAFR